MRPALSDYEHLASGKVRELYRVDDETLLFVASDRISAYDYVLDSLIPDKGRILDEFVAITGLSRKHAMRALRQGLPEPGRQPLQPRVVVGHSIRQPPVGGDSSHIQGVPGEGASPGAP